MSAVSTLDMTPARRRIFEAGNEAQARMAHERDAAMFRDAVATLRAVTPMWRKIVNEAADKHDVSPDDVLGRDSSASVCAARNEAYYRLANETAMRWTEIGRRMGRHHSTAIICAGRHAERNGLPILVGMRGLEIQAPRPRDGDGRFAPFPSHADAKKA